MFIEENKLITVQLREERNVHSLAHKWADESKVNPVL
ncbi:MAG: hypothetical protein QOF72_2087 [Blastocatellia bacterium]|jgi:hypothetical protein|nr:hypothetical protein [Blastocatellia bacterium]